MLRTRRRRAGATVLAAAAAHRLLAHADAHALAGDLDWPALRRGLSPDVERLVRADGRLLVVDCYGPPNAPPLVLLHGWTCTARFWTRQIQALREHYRLLVPDMRGHGRSAPASDYSIEALSDDLELVI